jgi:hypothetical protein
MVTFRSSHWIESLGDATVGKAVAVAVGDGIGVTVAVASTVVDLLCVVQAVRMNNPMNKILDNFFKVNMMNSVIYLYEERRFSSQQTGVMKATFPERYSKT